jgi:membrane associated rhomboid family serine protease
MEGAGGRFHPEPMRTVLSFRRIVAGILWFLAGWYVGALISFVAGVDGTLGPVLGGLWAAVVLVDPLRRLWRQDSPARSPGR